MNLKTKSAFSLLFWVVLGSAPGNWTVAGKVRLEYQWPAGQTLTEKFEISGKADFTNRHHWVMRFPDARPEEESKRVVLREK